MVTNDARNLRVVINLAENAFADLRVLFHATSLLEREGARLLKQAGRKTHLADVVDESAKVSQVLLLLRQTKSARNVAGVDRDGSRMTRGVLIPGV